MPSAAWKYSLDFDLSMRLIRESLWLDPSGDLSDLAVIDTEHVNLPNSANIIVWLWGGGGTS